MPIGIVSDSDFFAELSSIQSTPNIPSVPKKEDECVSVPSIPSEESDSTSEGQGTAVSTSHIHSVEDEHVILETIIPNIIPIAKRGRTIGDNNVPDSLRQVIASTALMDGREAALQLAADFGISPSSVSAYTKGSTSTTSYNEPKPSIVNHINKTRERAIKRASKTLNAALGSITQDKLDYTDAPDLARIAKDMSAIIKNLEPPAESGDSKESKAPQFILYAPQFRDERSYETIKVLE